MLLTNWAEVDLTPLGKEKQFIKQRQRLPVRLMYRSNNNHAVTLGKVLDYSLKVRYAGRGHRQRETH